MHYSNLVIIEKTEDIDAAVEKAMGAHKDQGGFWDWYQIGGRWTGALDGYDPDKDPANIETCTICDGSGKRTDMEVKDGCNGCAGTGKRVTWPTQWGRHDGDIAPVESLTEEHYVKFYRIVTPWASVYGGEKYMPWKSGVEEKFLRLEKPPLEWLKKEYAGHLVVVVDNHS